MKTKHSVARKRKKDWVDEAWKASKKMEKCRLKQSNELLRSAYQIAIREFRREGNRYTHWEGFITQLEIELDVQHTLMYPSLKSPKKRK